MKLEELFKVLHNELQVVIIDKSLIRPTTFKFQNKYHFSSNGRAMSKEVELISGDDANTVVITIK